jgi:hypothetical protein
MRRALLALALLPMPAFSDEKGERAPEEVVVYGDPYARWDGTRWYVDTQIGFPRPYVLEAKVNHMMEATAVELKMTIACEKTWRRSKSRHEVDCKIEDVGLQAASWRKEEPYAQEILDEFDANLSKADIQLIVSDDGRLVDVDLEGLEGDNDREKTIREEARMLLARAMVGFHMKLPPRNQIREGQWVEYDSQVFQMPLMMNAQRTNAAVNQGVQGATQNAGANRGAIVVNSIGGSYIIHQLDRYKGHLVVQSVGEGTVEVGDSNPDDAESGGNQSWFKINLDGVAIYDEQTGIMTERVWSMHGRTTAGSSMADGRVDPLYFHNGRIRMLGKDEKVEVGPTQRVERPGVATTTLPRWIELQ